MKTIRGRGASHGLAMGELRILRRDESATASERAGDASVELVKFRDAVDSVSVEFEKLYKNALLRVGEREAGIFEIHKMMLEDEDFYGEAERLITEERLSAVEASKRAGEALADTFREMDTEYMRARAEDIIAVSGRVCEVLRGESRAVELTSPCIIAADDLTPAETILLDREMVLGFVTERGSDMSHTAILARMMGIPAVVSTGHISDEYDGCTVLIDGEAGEISIDPDEESLAKYRSSRFDSESERARLERMRGKTCVTSEGVRILVTANVGDLADTDEAVRHDAEGIGLFRSEFMFMSRTRPPTEDEQYEIYLAAAKKMNGQECVVRTLDVGADKRIPYLTGDAKEANPALGIRAVRLSLRMPELLLTQFRALYRAAAEGNISAMIPMISLPSEVEAVRDIAAEARASLESEGMPCGKMKVGIMVETPSAAILSDLLAPMVDFFSIGTNDLIQYTLAADRENPDVAYLRHPLPESVRRCIKMTCSAARREGIPVCVCGELGADTDETDFLIDAGVTKISVSPPYVLRVREAVVRRTGMTIKRKS